ncbi:NAD(P)/FAD-dependent oxidoreductase [bacterium]|nr:MAG: NAD(P)/FAD-dependent oxidoreductase [bacterium]
MADDDVVIAGAGPAGSALALRLARAGVKVRVVERSVFPRTKVCGEYLSPGALRELETLGLGKRIAAHAAPCHGIRLYAARGDPLALAFKDGEALALERCVLDAVLLEAACAAGAFHERARVEGVIVEHGRATGLRVREPSGLLSERRGRVVVGADGIGSVVARRLGLAREVCAADERFALGGHIRSAALDGWISMFAGAGAYFAVNPLGGERANVMLVLRQREIAAWGGCVDVCARQRIARLVGERAPLTLFPADGRRMAVGPLRQRVRRPDAPGALLVGDAAGFLDPFTGQGVWMALEGARHAADAILGVLHGDVRERWAWRRYARACRRSWLPRWVLSSGIGLLRNRDGLAMRAIEQARAHRTPATALLGACAGRVSALRRPPEQ